MSENKMTSRVENDEVLVLERVFAAPRALVFEMFKECDHLKQWWGPRGWTLTVCQMDFRPGGSWLYCMKCVDESQGEFFGMESWGKEIYHDIVEPERITYTDYFTDAEGTINEGMPSGESVLQFIDQGSTTKVISTTTYASSQALKTVMDMGMLQGITETWDRLEERIAAVK